MDEKATRTPCPTGLNYADAPNVAIAKALLHERDHRDLRQWRVAVNS